MTLPVRLLLGNDARQGGKTDAIVLVMTLCVSAQGCVTLVTRIPPGQVLVRTVNRRRPLYVGGRLGTRFCFTASYPG